MLSTLELRHLVESAFLPICCRCRVESLGYLQVEIFDSKLERRQLLVQGISQAELTGNQAITNLIKEIRGELYISRQVRFSARGEKEV